MQDIFIGKTRLHVVIVIYDYSFVSHYVYYTVEHHSLVDITEMTVLITY